MRKSVDLIIKNGIILTQDENDTVYLNGALAVLNGKIEEIGETRDIEKKYHARKVTDASLKAVLPGFVNTHFHFTQNFMKGTQDNLDLLDWIDKISFPRIKVSLDNYRKGLSDIHRLAVMHAGMDLLCSGVTCTTNMEWGMNPAIKEAYDRIGLRIINILTLTDIDSWTPKEAIIEVDEVFALASDLVDAFRDDNGRIDFAYGIACPNSCSGKMIQRAAKEAREKSVRLHIHLAETRFEYDTFLKKENMTPTKYMDSLGFWGSDVWAAHSIWLDSDDIDILARHKVGVAHNPKCNMKIASGAAPILEMLNRGIEVGLGIDSCAVSDNTDFFEAMRTMIFLQRVTTMNPKAILGKEALKIATLRGAKVLGKERIIGSLEQGKQADLILVDLTGINIRPYNDLVNNLVYAANSGNIESVMVGGEFLVENKKFTRFDRDTVLDETEREAAALYRSAGIKLPPYFMIKDLQGGT